MKWWKKLLDLILRVFRRRLGRTDDVAPYDEPVIESADNVLLHKGRAIRWWTPGGKQIDQYDSGYIENTNRFLDVIAAHWEGIRYILYAKSGDSRTEKLPCKPIHLHISVLSWMTPAASDRTCVRAIYLADSSPCARVPDTTEWRVTFPGRYVLRFGHTHRGDTMAFQGRAWWYAPDGHELFSWICNHPHVVNVPERGLQRVDIRYTGGSRPPVEVRL